MTAAPPDRTDTGLHRRALTALAFATFVYVTAETLPVGLLPEIAHGMSVSEAQVGLLLTTYAAVAGLTAIPFTALTVRVPRHRLITLCVTVFAVSQLLAALAPTFAVLVGARLVAALAHGVFWSTIAPVATRLAPPGQGGRATALVFVGNATALVAGNPLATALGQLAGWRVALGALAVAGALGTVALVRLLPPLPATDTSTPTTARLRAAVAVVRRPPVAVVCLVTGVVVIGQFTAYTYIAPLAHRGGGLAGLALSALLLGYGAAGIAGNLLAGRMVDRRPGPSLAAHVTSAAAGLLLIGLAPGPVGTVLAVLAWGVGFAAVPVSLQSTILRVAPDAQDAASAVYVVAFQIGIGGGAFVGERLVSTGHLGTLPFVAVATTLVTAGIVVANRTTFPRRITAGRAAAAERVPVAS